MEVPMLQPTNIPSQRLAVGLTASTSLQILTPSSPRLRKIVEGRAQLLQKEFKVWMVYVALVQPRSGCFSHHLFVHAGCQLAAPPAGPAHYK